MELDLHGSQPVEAGQSEEKPIGRLVPNILVRNIT
jgi:hypothetical protein